MIRKLRLVILFSVILFLNVSGYVAAAEMEALGEKQTLADFTGEWDWIEADEGSSFYVQLKQSGDQIKGLYCATAMFGNRVDCGFEEGSCPIIGTVTGNVAKVEFTSCFGGKSGKAKIIHRGDQIEWFIEEVPDGRWYFCPRRAILDRHLKIWKNRRQP